MRDLRKKGKREKAPIGKGKATSDKPMRRALTASEDPRSSRSQVDL